MTSEASRLIESLRIESDLVLEFIAFFSRFEFSLKRSGFLMRGKQAKPDWDTYATSILGRFEQVQDQGFREAIKFLIKEPPRTQVVLNNGLGWRDTLPEGQHHEGYVLRLVRTVRNNLFHGGKYPVPFGPIEDVARNRHLLRAAIIVLDQCLKISESVRAMFEEAV